MPRPDESTQPRITIPEKLKQTMAELLEAYDYATDVQSDVWEFAISIQRLLQLGANKNDLRWLRCREYVEHAREVTVAGDDGRGFRSTGDLTFSRHSCFVLTDAGVKVARLFLTNRSHNEKLRSTSNGNVQTNHVALDETPVPRWDADARKLHVNGKLVKQFKLPAANQEAVLCAFQEEGWPGRIDDPIPPQLDQNPKRRLADTIKWLNKGQINQLMRFHGDGTGEGVIWELLELDSYANGDWEPPVPRR